MNPDSSFVSNTQKWNWYWSSDLTARKKANKLICPKYQTIPLTPVSFSVSVFGDSSDLIGRPCRNKRCEAGLGERVAVFYEPLKFYSSLHRGSLRPRGHRALNKLSSFLYPLLPNICLPTPLPPNPSIHRLNGLFIVWCSSPTSSFFSPLSRSLSVFCPPLVCSGVEVWGMRFVCMMVLCADPFCVWVCASMSVLAPHTCCKSINSFGVSCFWPHPLFPLLFCFMDAYQTFKG